MADIAKARSYSEKACALKNGDACTNAAGFWAGASEPNFVKARELGDRACTLGTGRGCYAVGVLWKEGAGGAADAGKARAYLDRGCSLDSGPACYALGIIWKEGAGPSEQNAARPYFEKACSLGVRVACEEKEGGGPCMEKCKLLLRTGDLKAGMGIDECVRALCGLSK